MTRVDKMDDAAPEVLRIAHRMSRMLTALKDTKNGSQE